LISIKNPTSESISLNNYYISDNPNYYKIQTENDLSPGHLINDFLVKFPESSYIAAGDSILISIQSNYIDYYGENFVVDFTLRDDMIETEPGSVGLSSNGRLDDAQECLILFYWDGNESSPVKDVDYFLWGGISQAIDKSSVLGYSDDTAPESQEYLPPHETHYIFNRQSFEEEEVENGNGLTGHNETSEPFISTWTSITVPEFNFGCMNELSDNYNPSAEIDDGSCYYLIPSVINNCDEEVIACDGNYDLYPDNSCELYGYFHEITIAGSRVIDFYDITPYNGPYTIKLGLETEYINLVVWPGSSNSQDGFDIMQTDLAVILQPPYDIYEIRVTGNLGVYCGDDGFLDISTDWQLIVEYEENIEIVSIIGDLNLDLELDILDVVLMVGNIINDNYLNFGDINHDGNLDILDIVLLVEIILPN